MNSDITWKIKKMKSKASSLEKQDLSVLSHLLEDLSLEFKRESIPTLTPTDNMPINPTQTLITNLSHSISWNLQELKEQIDKLSEDFDSLKFRMLITHSLGFVDQQSQQRFSDLYSGLIKLSKLIKDLTNITRDSELEGFYYAMVEIIEFLFNEKITDTPPDTLIELVPDRNEADGGGNGSSGSGDSEDGFPSPNPKLMSSNRSMPTEEPQQYHKSD